LTKKEGRQLLEPCCFMKPPYIQCIALYVLVSYAIRQDMTGTGDRGNQTVNSSQQMGGQKVLEVQTAIHNTAVGEDKQTALDVDKEAVDEIDAQALLKVQTQQLFGHEIEVEIDEEVQTPTLAHETEGTVSFRALLVAFSYSKIGNTLHFTCKDLELVSQWLKGKSNLDATIGYVTDDCSVPEGMIDVLPRKTSAVDKSLMHQAFKWLLEGATEGDTLFFYYSGHGLRLGEVKGEGGYSTKDQCKGSTSPRDEPLGEGLWLPKTSSQDAKKMLKSVYTDTDFYKQVVERVPLGVHLFAVVDACHSGTFMNLPWNWISQEYHGTCPADPDKRVFEETQFAWERKSVTSVEEMPQFQVTVSLIAASQSYQKSMESAVKTEGYGAMTSSLFLDNTAKNAPAIMNEALEQGLSWAFTISSLVRRMAMGEEANLHKTPKNQIPNFCTSHLFDMSEALSLDGAAIKAGKAVQEEVIQNPRKRKALESRLSCSKSDTNSKVHWKKDRQDKCEGIGNGKSR